MPGRIAIIGCGVIGSHLVALAARMAPVREMLLIDPERYEPRNLGVQAITAEDVGKDKVLVQSKRAMEANPQIRVSAFNRRVQDIPWGLLLGADLVMSCLDSRAARVAVNEITRRLGVPWIDAGCLGGDAALVRISQYPPGESAACLECGFAAADYHELQQQYPCDAPAAPAPTNAPTALGALAASWQALVALQAFAEDARAGSRELVMDASANRLFATELRRNPGCRFDHTQWSIRPLPVDLGKASLRTLVELGEPLRVPGNTLMREAVCQSCGERKALPGLERLTRTTHAACQNCGGALRAAGYGCSGKLTAESPNEWLATSLFAAGLSYGDIVQAGNEHYVLRPEEIKP